MTHMKTQGWVGQASPLRSPGCRKQNWDPAGSSHPVTVLVPSYSGGLHSGSVQDARAPSLPCFPPPEPTGDILQPLGRLLPKGGGFPDHVVGSCSQQCFVPNTKALLPRGDPHIQQAALVLPGSGSGAHSQQGPGNQGQGRMGEICLGRLPAGPLLSQATWWGSPSGAQRRDRARRLGQVPLPPPT